MHDEGLADATAANLSFDKTPSDPLGGIRVPGRRREPGLRRGARFQDCRPMRGSTGSTIHERERAGERAGRQHRGPRMLDYAA